MTDTAIAAPPAAPAAPAVVPAPVAAPAAPAHAPAATFGGRGSNPSSSIDPSQYPIKEDYAAAVLKEKLAAIPAQQPVGEESRPDAVIAAVTESAAAATAPESGETPAVEGEVQPGASETEFRFDPPAVVTPESMGKLATDHPEFGRLLESAPELKDALYLTAREAAELQPYREIFPDLQAAQAASAGHSTWTDMQATFMASGTPEGTMATLKRMAELSYERDDAGAVVTRNGRPVIADDFFGFVDNVVTLDLDHRLQQIEARLKKDAYRSEDQRASDETVKAALEVLKNADEQPEGEELTDRQRELQKELDRRDKEFRDRDHQKKVTDRTAFDRGVVKDSQDLVNSGINGILDSAVKQGAVIAPYLREFLAGAIGNQLIEKIKGSTYAATIKDLQRLPANASARQQRLDTVQRAVKHFLPEIAREELRKAEIAVPGKASAAAPKPQQNAASGQPMSSNAAFDQAQAEWMAANPGQPFDKVAREKILPRVLRLMSGAA